MIRVYAPATSANVNVGFDSLGVALSPIDGTLLGDIVQIDEREVGFHFESAGRFQQELPSDPQDNLAYVAYQLFIDTLAKKGNAVKPLTLRLEKNMPIGSGLGSSACSIVASLVALNHFHDKPFSDKELLYMMGELEGCVSGDVHYDNVAPCFLGGMQLMQNDNICSKIPTFDQWYWVLAYSGLCLPTAQARAVLPQVYDKKTVILQSRYFANFVAGCFSGDEQQAANSLQDLIAEPYRCHLLPNFERCQKNAKNYGALAFGISGAGPSIFAITNNLVQAQQIAQSFSQHYVQNHKGFVHICQANAQGAIHL